MKVIKVISIGGGGYRMEVGGICYIEIEEDWGNNRALRNTSVDNAEFGVYIIVGAVDHPAT